MSEEPASDEEHYIPIGRRGFMVMGALSTAAICYTIWNALIRRAPRRIAGKWAFIMRSPDTHPEVIEGIRTSEDVQKNLKKVGPLFNNRNLEFELLPEVRGLVYEAQRRIEQQRRWNRTELEVTSQLFAVPDREMYREQALSYCRGVHRLMCEDSCLEGLDIFPILTWEGILPGVDYSKNCYGKDFVGHSAYMVYRVLVRNRENPSEEEGCDILPLYCRSIFMVDNPITKFTYIPMSMQENFWSPVLAIIYGATRDQHRKLERGLGLAQANAVDVAFYESLRYYVGQKVFKDLGVPNSEFLNQMFLSLLKKDPKSMKVLGLLEGDLEGTIEGYMGDPVGFGKNLLETSPGSSAYTLRSRLTV